MRRLRSIFHKLDRPNRAGFVEGHHHTLPTLGTFPRGVNDHPDGIIRLKASLCTFSGTLTDKEHCILF